MSMILFSLGLVAAAVLFWQAAKRTQRFAAWNRVSVIMLLAAIGLAARLMASLLPYEWVSDLNCFRAWSRMLFEDGMQNFYASDSFTDYPPGYMYVLTVLGAIRGLFGVDNSEYVGTLIIKMPAILADVGMGVFIFLLAEKRMTRLGAAAASLMYLLNPAIIVLSACWGQVDSIHTLLIAVSVYGLAEKKLLRASLLFAAAVLVKPQALMFTPLYMFAYVMEWKDSGFKRAKLLDLLINIMACLIMLIVLMLPFAPFKNWQFDLGPVMKQYVDTLSSYPYVTVNGYNIYALFGKNWESINDIIIGNMTYDKFGMIALFVTVIVSFFLLWRGNKESKSKYFFTAAFINFSTFMFSVKMHERYSFPILALMLIACVLKGNKKRLKYLYMGMSVAFFANYADILRGGDVKDTLPIFSMMAVVVYILLLNAFVVYKREEKDAEEDTGLFGNVLRAFGSERKPFAIEKKEDKLRYTWRELAVLGVIVLAYAIVAFANMGNTKSAQSGVWVTNGQVIELEFDQDVEWSRMQYFLGARSTREITLEVSNNGERWSEPILVEAHGAFAWGEKDFEGRGRYIRMTMSMTVSPGDGFQLLEMAFEDVDGVRLVPVRMSEGAEPLFDEQDLVPERRSYMNGTYFDEIYHARTAYELEEGIKVYEWTHPPLGKVIIALGVRVFGMTPFGWRVMGTTFGVLMLPLLYIFARKLFRKPMWAAFATALFAVDFMHYAQTRIATIDTYITFFVIAMYFFMYKYYTMTFYTDDANEGGKAFRKTLGPLFLSGLCMGLGIASKWPGMYAGLGLAVLFAATLFKRYREYDYALRNRLEGNYKNFPRYALYTCLWCVLFFLVIPAVIYVLSYVTYFFGTGSLYPVREANRLFTEIPFFDAILPKNEFGTFLGAIIQNQRDIFGYHAGLDSAHPYSSDWWEWILNLRPIFYYVHRTNETVNEGISAFGNPMVWWGGLAALIAMAWKAWKSWNKKILFLLIAYLAQVLPWMLVSRTTYIYHYFPSVPFLILFLTYAMKMYMERPRALKMVVTADGEMAAPDLRWIAPAAILAVATVLFIMFYPVLTGTPVSVNYVDTFLKWLPRWQLL